jgi:hypothetical protein
MKDFDLKKYLTEGRLLQEAYEDSLSPDTMKTLKQKSASSAKDMLDGKSFMEASMKSMEYLQKVMNIEKPYRKELEDLALKVIYEEFPIVKQAGIRIEAQLVDPEGLNMEQSDSEEEIDIPSLDKMKIDKRRLINSITQGASIRGTKAYYWFKDKIDEINPSLIDDYNELLKVSYGIYDDDEAIAMMMAMLSQNQGSQGGESEAEFDEETDTLTIRAKALIFPILIHEIIKGLYEIVSLQGFTGDKEKNKDIVQKVDKTSNEPEDLRYGKFIYDALRDQVKDISKKELYFAEIYKLENEEFIEFIENSINDKLTSAQKRFSDETNELIKNM